MTHSLCTSDAGGVLPSVQRLWRTLLAPNIDPKVKLEELFDHETTEFGLNFAFLSTIDLETETQRFEVVHGSHEMLHPGTTVSLAETYCRKTIADPEGTLAVTDAVAEGWAEDPAYETFELGSYLGTTVLVDDELYGTLCFANTSARDDPFHEEEKAILELHSQWVEYTLALFGMPPFQETRSDAIEARAVSSDAIDSMMGALQSPLRRVVLMALLGDTTEVSVATLERQVDHEHARLRLYHTELPKLAHDGYIVWDADSDTVSTGPRFVEVKPLVQLLKEYDTAFPE